MIQLYQKITHLKILQHFYENPFEEFYLRELGRILDISPMTVKRSLDVLVNDHLLLREERKNQILYRANSENMTFRYSKIAYNLAWIEDKKIIDQLLEKIPGVSSIILYGSYAKGENDEYSDLDLLIISSQKKVPYIDMRKQTGLEINLMNFTGTQWTKQAENNRAFYLDIITEGIILYGTNPVVE